MKKSKLPIVLVGTEAAKASCVRCGASCRRPFGVRIEPESAHQVLTSQPLRPLLTGKAAKVLAEGWLPMVDGDQGPQCVFLQGSHECAVRAALGEQGLPRACRDFPITRVEDEVGSLRLGIRRGCSGAGKGDPAKPDGGHRLSVAPRLGLSSGRTLTREEYGPLLARFDELLTDRSPQHALAEAYRWLETVTAALDTGSSLPAALTIPTNRVAEHSIRRLRADYRLFLVGILTEFGSGTASLFALRPRGAFSSLRTFWEAACLTLGFGRVRVFGGPPVSARSLLAGRPASSAEASRALGVYLQELASRRQLFVRQTYLLRGLLELAFAATVATLVGRARALGAGRELVEAGDMESGIVVAESFVEAQLEGQSLVALEHLRSKMLAEESAYFGFLAHL